MKYTCEHCGEVFTDQAVCERHEWCCNFNEEKKCRVVTLFIDKADEKDAVHWDVCQEATKKYIEEDLGLNLDEVDINSYGYCDTKQIIRLAEYAEETSEQEQKMRLIQLTREHLDGQLKDITNTQTYLNRAEQAVNS